MGHTEIKCAYHAMATAAARCSSCDRNLCPACDHRIKGLPYCQDCIVAGIDILRRNANERIGKRIRSEEKSPLLALLFGLIPGLGAAYNGQNVKALVHFVVTAGLWTMADIFHSPLELILILGGIGFYIYSLYDAFTSAQHQRAGEDLQLEDERLKRFLQERTNIWGGLLIGVGLLATLNVFFSHYLYNFWPVLLILSGLYILRGFAHGQKATAQNQLYRTPPPSVIPSNYDRATSELAQAEPRYER